MGRFRPNNFDGPPVSKHGLIGGIVAMALTLGQYWLLDSGYFPLTMVFVGGLIAGYFAARNASPAARAGFESGIVGALPGVLLFLPELYETISEWVAAGAVLLAIVVIPLLGVVIFGGAGLIGLIGGSLGGWVRAVVTTRGTAPPTP